MQSNTDGDRESAEDGARDDWAAVVALGTLYVVISVVGHRLPIPPSVVSAIASVVLVFTLLMGIMYYAARVPAPPKAALVVGFGLLLAWVWLALLSHAEQTRPGIPAAVANVCLAAAAGALGKFAVQLISARNLLLPIAVAAAVFDVVYVFGGPLKTQRTVGGETLAAATAAVPALGGSAIPGASRHGVLGGVGFGDLAILAFYFAAADRFRMSAGRTFWCILPLSVGAFVAAMRFGDVPGWVPISLGFVLANLRFFEFTPEEKRAMLVATPVVVVLAGALIGAAKLVGK